MGCSVATLCCAAVAAMVAVALQGIAVATDNWQHARVDANAVERAMSEKNNADNDDLLSADDPRLMTRVRGLFRVCFPLLDKPVSDAMYLNPVEEWCTNVDYFLRLDEGGLLPDEPELSHNARIWLHVSRAAVAAFCLFFMWAAVAFAAGLVGCWKANADHLVSTAVLMMMAALSGGAGMGLYHWAQFYEMEKVFDSDLGFYQTWPSWLRSATRLTPGWSYVLSWVSVGVALVASILFTCSALCIRADLRRREDNALRLKMHMLAYNQAVAPSVVMARSNTGGPPSIIKSVPSTPQLSKRNSLYQTYFPAGYPVHYEDINVNYRNVVKELEDAKL